MNPTDPQAFAPLVYILSPLPIAAAGLTIMVGYRQFGARLLGVGAFLPVVGALSPMWLEGSHDAITLYWNWLTGCIATVGGSMIILGHKQAGLALAMPAINRFIVIPTFAPILRQTPWELLLTSLFVVVIVGGPAIVRGLLRGALLDQIFDFLFGWLGRPKGAGRNLPYPRDDSK